MILPAKLREKLYLFLWSKTTAKRSADLFIGSLTEPYLERWYVIPRNPVFNIYLHRIRKSDDDRALHDHPWWNVSVLLQGRYDEIQARPDGRQRLRREEGQIIFRRGKTAHALMLDHGFNTPVSPVTSLFITGPRFRQWGFWCPQGWKPAGEVIERKEQVSVVGAGCGEE